jgi:ElaB/YqjD/DUF883 family membrane-anchored ribosome-binding protein
LDRESTCMNARQEIKERLSEELKTIAEDAEELVRARGAELAEKTKDIRDRIASALETAEETMEAVQTHAAAGVKATDKSIRNHPYQSIGVALGIGLAIGLLLKKK